MYHRVIVFLGFFYKSNIDKAVRDRKSQLPNPKIKNV